MKEKEIESLRHHFEIDETNIHKEFREIVVKPCRYCGAPPSQLKRITYKSGTESSFLYTGVDRIDNAVGYEPNNVCPCCFVCNRMKSDYNEQEFYNHIRKILGNTDSKQKTEEVL